MPSLKPAAAPDNAENKYLDFWLKTEAARKDGFCLFQGRRFLVPKKVFSFSSSMTNSTAMLFRHAGKLKGKTVWDVGTGSGVLGITAVLNGARSALLTDTSDDALDAARKNVERLGVAKKVAVQKSDAHKSVAGKFDVILANLPMADRAWKNLKHGEIEDIYHQFLTNAKSFLSPKGHIVLAQASFGDPDHVREKIAACGFHAEEHIERKFGVAWHSFVLRPSV